MLERPQAALKTATLPATKATGITRLYSAGAASRATPEAEINAPTAIRAGSSPDRASNASTRPAAAASKTDATASPTQASGIAENREVSRKTISEATARARETARATRV